MDIEFLDEYTLYVIEADHSILANWGWKFSADKSLGREVRFVRGRKSQSVDSMFDEFSAALQFPYYFGENWDAFNECISDLDTLECKFCVVVILDAELLLADKEQEFEVLVSILQEARENRTTGLQSIDDADVQKDLPFFVILQCSAESKNRLVQRLKSVNAKYI